MKYFLGLFTSLTAYSVCLFAILIACNEKQPVDTAVEVEDTAAPCKLSEVIEPPALSTAADTDPYYVPYEAWDVSCREKIDEEFYRYTEVNVLRSSTQQWFISSECRDDPDRRPRDVSYFILEC